MKYILNKRSLPFVLLAVFLLGTIAFAEGLGDIIEDIGGVGDEKFEFISESTTRDAGENKVELLKNEPKITLKKWNEEVALSVSYGNVRGSGVKEEFSNKVEWRDINNTREELHAYPLAARSGMEDGGFEIEVVLNELPDTNVFNFTIEGAENLNFFYQAPLDEEPSIGDEICSPTECLTDGVVTNSRPENVIGSYAVYHRNKRDHIEGQTNYATGKAFHIYRPKAIDANGAETWAEMSYTNGTLSVTVPQRFLDNAVYPVQVDPTLGFTGIGASATTNTGLTISSPRVQADASGGTMTKIQVAASDAGGDSKIKIGIYNDVNNGGTDQPSTLVAGSYPGELTVTRTSAPTQDSEWTSSTNVSGTIVASTYYWPAFNLESNTINVYYDSAAGGWYNIQTYAAALATYSAYNSIARKHSIYATYSAAGTPVSWTSTVQRLDVQGPVIFMGQVIIQ